MLLLKGSLANFRHSLKDFLERGSDLIKRYPPGTFLWGFKRVDARVKSGIDVFIYVTRNEYNEGGIALYGTLKEVAKASVRYWPEGEWAYLAPIAVKATAPGVVDHPDDPSKWRVVTRAELRELGVTVLPGVQNISQDIAEKIVARLVKV